MDSGYMDSEREFFSRIASSKALEETTFDTYFDSFKPGYDVIKPVLPSTASIFDNCTACNASGDSIYTDEQVVCLECGEVLGRPLDTSAEYRFFGADDKCGGDPSRIGAPTDHRLPESSLGTVILPSGSQKNMNRIRRYHQWNMLPYKERALLGAFDRLNIAANNNGLSGSIVEDSKELYTKLNNLCDRRGLSRDSLLASCVYAALKRAGCPRRPQEIGVMFNLNHASFTKAFKFFQEVLAQAVQKGILGTVWSPGSLTSTRAADYVELPLSKLPVSRAEFQKLVCRAQELADKAEAEALSPENTPPSLAAGIVAYVCEEWKKGEISLARIAAACNVSPATLQKCYRRLEQSLS
jgi:transcription initiation factor TFIIIB Brf1 subunit/transcription initiation factor TFIIB